MPDVDLGTVEGRISLGAWLTARQWEPHMEAWDFVYGCDFVGGCPCPQCSRGRWLADERILSVGETGAVIYQDTADGAGE